ncbi:MAG: hypothetical protein COB24_09990 [Hyphomicrobiales bacterium]|nr:MAG: hypothetical protein COB24_09990 [Hyphomicrobiales bacterium]
MKQLKYFYIFIAVFAAINSANASDLTKSIRNFKPLVDNISTGGTISSEGFLALSDNEFDIIIDARTPPEGTAAEQKQVEALGMQYFNLPIDGRSIPQARVTALAKILAQNKGKKILLHCVSANRAGALWAEYQISQGTEVKAALAQGRKIGMGRGLENWIRDKHKISN